jgi:hypothetical protein
MKRKIKHCMTLDDITDEEMFLKIMSCNDKYVTDALGQFIYNSMKIRVIE